jgi:hypothetical protein
VVLPDAASLAVRVRAADGEALHGIVLRLDTPEWQSSEDIPADQVDGVHRKAQIDAGSYVLRLIAADVAPQSLRIELGAGERRELELVAQRGVPVDFELQCADRNHNGLCGGTLTIRSVGGDPLVVHSLWGYFEDYEHRIRRVRLALLPGSYRVTAREQQERSTDLVVPSAVPVVLDLR